MKTQLDTTVFYQSLIKIRSFGRRFSHSSTMCLQQPKTWASLPSQPVKETSKIQQDFGKQRDSQIFHTDTLSSVLNIMVFWAQQLVVMCSIAIPK